ncbi:MAG: HlyD family efflux transporter periplasmic adaptor subunit [bacterium]|nr:HlyD family efflux transporter periplasmic adaptor subunit [bacterium]
MDRFVDAGLWKQFRQSATLREFSQTWLTLQCHQLSNVSQGLVVMRSQGGGDFVPLAFWPKYFQPSAPMAAVTERVLKEEKGLLQPKPTDPDDPLADASSSNCYVAYPIQRNGVLYGAVVLDMGPRPQSHFLYVMRQLQWGMAWLETVLHRQEFHYANSLQSRITTAFHIAASAVIEPTFRAGAMAFVTELATRLGCERVSLGFVKRGQVQVMALSHSAQFGKQMDLLRAIGAAMDECVDQREILLVPRPADKPGLILRAHEELRSRQEIPHLCSFPFVDAAGHCYGALLLERSNEEPFTAETVEMCESLVSLIAPILNEKYKNDRWLIRKIWDSFYHQLGKLVGPGSMVLKLAVLLVVSLTVFFWFATGDYQIRAQSNLEGTVQRAVVAPYTGFIRTAEVRAGETVTQNQVLCTLDDRDMALELQRWESREEQYTRQYQKAMAEGDRSSMVILQEQINQAKAQIALLGEQIARAKILSPLDGVVVRGDLNQSLGAPVERGQVLFEVAPLNSYRVILSVDERDIREVAAGQRGYIMPNALPGQRFPFVIERIVPVSTPKEGRNYFRVEASLEQVTEQLRPGMEGYGRVEIGQRKMIWIWTHDLFQWLRLSLWTWWP